MHVVLLLIFRLLVEPVNRQRKCVLEGTFSDLLNYTQALKFLLENGYNLLSDI
jgi:hypothetical protein